MDRIDGICAWPLSDGQRALLIDQQLRPEGTAYHVPAAVHLAHGVDVEALRRSIARVVRQHSILRSTVHPAADGPVQRVHAPPDEPAQLVSVRGWSDEEVTRAMESELHRPFALEREFPLRVCVYDGGERGAWFLLVAHHIAVDLGAMQVLVGEILEHYGHPGEGDASPAASFGELVEAQRVWLASDAGAAGERWWAERLRDASSEVPLGMGGEPGAMPGDGGRLERALPEELVASVDRLARASGATRYELLLGAWCASLHRATGLADLVVGSPTVVRWGRRYVGIVGYAVQPVLVRVQGACGWGLRRWIEAASRSAREARLHAKVPLPRQMAGLARRPGGVAWQVGFTFQRAHRRPEIGPFVAGVAADPVLFAPDLLASPWPVAHRASQTLLELVVVDLGPRAHASWVHDAGRLSRQDTAALADAWLELLARGCEAPDRSIDDLELGAPPPEIWSSPEGPREVEPLLASLASRVEHTPFALALDSGAGLWSYAALWSWSARIALSIQERGVVPEGRVAILARRPEVRVAALLGVWRAGAVAVPLDPDHPRARIDALCEEASVALVLDDDLDEAMGELSSSGGSSFEGPLPEGDRGAYVIFTSGSTGRPKPVLVSHGALSRHASAMGDALSLGAQDRVLQFHGPAFDVSLEELIPTLLRGATLVLRSEVSPAPGRELHALIEARRITVLNLPASYWHAWVDEIARTGEAPPPPLRLVVTGSERVRGDRLSRWLRHAPAIAWRSGYGPTEATITATLFSPREAEPVGETVPLGRPLPGVSAHVLDRALRRVPGGVVGELYLGGASLARGYLGQPDRTAERFLPDPFSREPGARMYRTGDRSRWSASGELSFLGRADQQVKIRGYRVELGEIERELEGHPSVRECAVRARDLADGTRDLVAWLSLSDPVELEPVRAWLATRLPGHMVPTAWCALDRLPRTAGGKVDVRSLPAPEAPGVGEAPATLTERRLAELWISLLGVSEVGREADFFALGGHSLAAMQLVGRAREQLGASLSLGDVFEHSTLSSLAARIDSLLASPAPPLLLPPLCSHALIEEPPLSFAQERLWFLDQLEPGGASYSMPGAVRLRGALDVQALGRVLEELVERHGSLRTTFASRDGEPFQVVHPSGLFSLLVEDLSQESTRDLVARQRVADEAGTPFDLSRGPLFRASLLRLRDDEHVLVLNMHHIVSDGWSFGVLVREVGALYSAFTRGQPSPLSPLPVQYADYAAWQREWLTGEVLGRQLAYWKEQLAGLPSLELPTDRPRPAVQSSRGATHSFTLPVSVVEGLRELGRSRGTTLFMVLLAAFEVLLYRHTGQVDFGVGTPVANRTRHEVEGLIGFFVNTLVMRADLAKAPSFLELLERVRASSLCAYAHQDAPFERVVEALGVLRDMSTNPLFQVMFSLQNAPSEPFQLPGLTLTPEAIESTTSKFDLSLTLSESAEGPSGALEYATDLFDASTIERMAQRFWVLLQGIVANPGAPVSRLPVMSEQELHQVLVLWNDTSDDAGCALVQDLVDAQARLRPDAVAVVGDDATLTYAQLVARSEVLAHELCSLGVGPEVRVVVCAERRASAIVALLAVLRSGGVYVPVDPEHPIERRAQILEDCGARVVVTHAHLAEGLSGRGARVVDLDAVEGAARIAPRPLLFPDHTAYVIYTSGSTGRPKGVAVTHSGLSNLVLGTQRRFGFEAGDVVPCLASMAFDISLFEQFSALCWGGTALVLARHELLDPTRLALRVEPATVLHAVPALMAALVAHVREHRSQARYRRMRRVFVGGDAVPPELPSAMGDAFVEARVEVLYGPTEGTILATSAPVEPARPGRGHGLGRPLPNVSTYVLDGSLRPLPIGVAGELCLGGAGVARGYLDRPDLTAERFVPDPFSREPGARMYRTGDLVRWSAAGELEFLGRIDHQVKIRGYRIELGEVESALSSHPSVRACAVVAREDTPGDRRLVAYVVGEVGASALREHLKGSLPDYMVPGTFVSLDTLPLTPNGKIDRRALPAPEGHGESERYQAPRSPTEQALAEIWASVLGVPRVGIRDDFFALGGHSLLVMKVASRVREALGLELPLREVFAHPALHQLAARIDALMAAPFVALAPPLRPHAREAEIPASFAQERLWFIDRLDPGQPTYHMPMALRLRGALDVGALREALQLLVDRHEALRTVFHDRDGRCVQVVLDRQTVALRRDDTSGCPDPLEAALGRVQEVALAPFDLSLGPVLRSALVRVGEDDHVFVLVVHHIACDGASLEVLAREVGAGYRALVCGRAPSLPALPVQYSDYALWQREWLTGEVLESQLAWWRARLLGIEALELPSDRGAPPAVDSRGGAVAFTIPEVVGSSVCSLSRRAGATTFMTLLAAFAAWVGGLADVDEVIVGTPTAGRTDAALEGVVGFFVNTLALPVSLTGRPTFLELVARVRALCIEALAHQHAPFASVVEAMRPERDLTRHPLFQVGFALQSGALPPVDLGGARIEVVELPVTTAITDLALTVLEEGDRWSGVLGYSAARFERETVVGLTEQFVAFLASVVSSPDIPFTRVDRLSPRERARLQAWSCGPSTSEPPTTLADLVEAQARLTPQAPAVLTERGEALTYAQLDLAADALAARLLAHGVGPERVVGVLLERSPAMVIALLGILKAGGACMPLDPSLPPSRLALLVGDADARVVVAHPVGSMPSWDFTGVLLSLDDAPPPERRGSLPRRHPEAAAYVLYTSGTTGRPKGVVLTHTGLCNRVLWGQRHFPLGPGHRVLQNHSFSFDVAIWEVFGPLVAGAATVLVDPGMHQDPCHLAALIARMDVTDVNFVPSMLHVFLDEPDVSPVPRQGLPGVVGHFQGASRCISLRRVFSGGEALTPVLVKRFFDRVPRAELHNLYGPTEASLAVSVWQCHENEHPTVIPIGAPIANTVLRVLDREGLPCPIGVAGELYLGGANLARGYLGQPEITASRFVPDPMSERPGARLYRTGDRARWRPDGQLEYLGRLDAQLKVRGHRIEPAEVESALCEHGSVHDAVVWTQRSGAEATLVAWVVPAEGHAVDASLLRAHMSSRLPSHMVPSAFMPIAAIPLTRHGKLDLAALPSAGDLPADQDYEAPRSATEQALAEMWASVLGVPRVGIRDDFFALGGHSLLATRVASRVRAALGVELPLREVFIHTTLHQLAARIDILGAGSSEGLPPLRPCARGVESPASFAQQRLWFLDQLEPGSSAYNMPSALSLRGALDVGALRGAFQRIVARHESLRTVFADEGGQTMQIVKDGAGVELELVDLSSHPDPEASARRDSARTSLAPFDLSLGPLMRLRLLRLSEDVHTLVIVLHHIVSDEVSIGVLVREVGVAYGALRGGEEPSLAPLPVQYADYARWQREWLTGEVLERQLDYWREQLGGLEPLELPTDRPRPAIRRSRGGVVRARVPRDLVGGLEALGKEEGATLFMVLLSAFSLLLSRWSGQDDVAVGTPVEGRSHPATEGLIGFFVNTLVLRADLSGAPTFRELLRRVRETCLGALSHQDVPFERIVEALNPARAPGITPLFQVMFSLHRGGAEPSLPELDTTSAEGEHGSAKFDITVDATAIGEGLSLAFDFDRDLWDDASIERMASHYIKLLEGILATPDARSWAIPMVPEEELSTALYAWNDTEQPIPEMATLHGLVEAQARRTPDAEAVRDGGRSMSYASLDRAAGVLAARLAARGAGPEVRVAVMAERSLAMIVALLGVLKSGAPYVPIDPDHPEDRINFALRDAGASLLVTTAGLVNRAPEGISVLVVDERAQDLEGFSVPVAPENLAYVIYTSGSTGRPKGVMVTHGNIAHHLQWREGVFPTGSGERFLFKAAFTFDISLWEIFGPLVAGGTVVIAPPGAQADPALLVDLIERESVTLALLQPTILAAVLEEPGLPRCSSLRRIFCGGEALTPELRTRLFRRMPGVRLHHLYGPTETTVDVAHHPCAPGEMRQSVPIGRPVGNTRAYVLDAALRPVPAGLPGELFIAGRGVARGYLARPDLTAERFVPDPFSPTPGLRMYRTGDRARWLPDGELEFLGRVGTQVKLRGYRIELGEIESVLRDHPQVRDAVAVVREDRPGERRLVTYVTSSALEAAEPAVLREHLSSKLPVYMVPSAIVPLLALPITSHGKVDRRALPAPEWHGEAERHEAPRSATEQALAEIWASVLGVPRVGIRDDFFALGGHSLLVTQVRSRVRSRLGVELPLAALFQHTTVEQQCALLGGQASSSSLLVPLHRGTLGTGAPFFCVHAIGGTVHRFALLARRLGPARSFFGLQAQGLDGSAPPLERVDAMASRYLEEIKRVQPEGPFHLGGWSMGGLVALEMACQLREEGHEVASLVLLDAFPFTGGRAWDDPPPDEALARVHRAHVSALRTWKPRAYPGRATLFSAEGTWGRSAEEHRAMWLPFIGEVEAVTVPGDHESMLDEPQVSALASALADRLS